MNRSELIKEATSLDFKKPNRLLSFDNINATPPKEEKKTHDRITDIIKAANKDKKKSRNVYEVN